MADPLLSQVPDAVSWAVSGAGLALLALGMLDFVWTTVSLKGSGPLTRRVGQGLWRVLQAPGGSAHRLTPVAGPLILVFVVCAWIAVTWVGWTLIFLGGGELGPGLDPKPGQEEPGLLQALAYIGSAISTLGSSLAQPTAAGWDLLSTLAAVNGMILLTLSVTFVLNVASAVAQGRALAMQTHAAWVAARQGDIPGASARAERAALALGEGLLQFVSQYAAFPLVGYFATGERRQHLPTAVLQLAWLLIHEVDESSEDAPGGPDASPGRFVPRHSVAGAAGEPQRAQMLVALETLIVASRGAPAPTEDWPPDRLLHEVELWYRANSLLPLPEWWAT